MLWERVYGGKKKNPDVMPGLKGQLETQSAIVDRL
jgi:hypothetical protein